MAKINQRLPGAPARGWLLRSLSISLGPKPHEENRFSVVRALDALAAIANAFSGGYAPAIHRSRCRGRGARRGRSLFPRAPLRPTARVALPSARSRRREDKPYRNRHGRHRHAIREPTLHGRGRRGGGPYCWRTSAAWNQPRLARAGDRGMALFGLSASRERK